MRYGILRGVSIALFALACAVAVGLAVFVMKAGGASNEFVETGLRLSGTVRLAGASANSFRVELTGGRAEEVKSVSASFSLVKDGKAAAQWKSKGDGVLLISEFGLGAIPEGGYTLDGNISYGLDAENISVPVEVGQAPAAVLSFDTSGMKAAFEYPDPSYTPKIATFARAGALTPNLKDTIFVWVSDQAGNPLTATLLLRALGIEGGTDSLGLWWLSFYPGSSLKKLTVVAGDKSGKAAAASFDVPLSDGRLVLMPDRFSVRAGNEISMTVYSTKNTGAVCADAWAGEALLHAGFCSLSDGKCRVQFKAPEKGGVLVSAAVYPCDSVGQETAAAAAVYVFSIDPLSELLAAAEAGGAGGGGFQEMRKTIAAKAEQDAKWARLARKPTPEEEEGMIVYDPLRLEAFLVTLATPERVPVAKALLDTLPLRKGRLTAEKTARYAKLRTAMNVLSIVVLVLAGLGLQVRYVRMLHFGEAVGSGKVVSFVWMVAMLAVILCALYGILYYVDRLPWHG